MAKKYYVVWRGEEPGVYTSWSECEKQVKGFQKALYKSFDTEEEAEEAFHSAPPEYKKPQQKSASKASTPNIAKAVANAMRGLVDVPTNRHDTVLPLPLEVTSNAWAVDAACSGNPGKMEYQGIDLRTGARVFHFGPVYGTNNIGEFLAIVHALALMKQKGITNLTIYSDSRNAISWVKNHKCKTTLKVSQKTEELFNIISRAEAWLNNNQYTTPIVKWQTEKWGEVPADFGRK